MKTHRFGNRINNVSDKEGDAWKDFKWIRTTRLLILRYIYFF